MNESDLDDGRAGGGGGMTDEKEEVGRAFEEWDDSLREHEEAWSREAWSRFEALASRRGIDAAAIKALRDDVDSGNPYLRSRMELNRQLTMPLLRRLMERVA